MPKGSGWSSVVTLMAHGQVSHPVLARPSDEGIASVRQFVPWEALEVVGQG